MHGVRQGDNMRQNDASARFILSRRAFLAAAASTGFRPAEAMPHILVEAADGGFRVAVGSVVVWHVKHDQISAAFGERATCEVLLHNDEIGRVEISNAALLGAGGHRIDISFTPDLFGHWTAGTLLSGPVLRRVTFAPRPLPPDSAADWSLHAPVSADLERRLRSLLCGTDAASCALRRLVLTRSGDLLLDAQDDGFVLLPSFPRFRSLRLLPGMTASRNGRPLAVAQAPSSARGATVIARHRGTNLRVEASLDELTVLIVAPETGGDSFVDCVGPLGLDLWSRGHAEGRFEGSAESRMRRTGHRDGTSSYRLDLALSDKDEAIETRHGNFVIRGVGGNGSRVTAETRHGRLALFEASAQLTHYGIRLPGADLGRLDFGDTECAFVLDGLPGPVAASTVRLGPSGATAVPPVQLCMDGARITVLRARELMAAQYRFRRVTLEAGSGPPRLLPRTVSQLSPGARGDPLLVVDLPPQHVAERAFARQLPELPGPGRKLEKMELGALGSAKDRQDLQDKLKASAPPEFRTFIDKWNIDAKDKKGTPDYVWLGPEGILTVWARQRARSTAERLKKEAAKPIDIEAFSLGLSPILVSDILDRSQNDANGAIDELLREAEKRSDDLLTLQDVYRTWIKGARKDPSQLPVRFVTTASIESWAKGLRDDNQQKRLTGWASSATVKKVPDAEVSAVQKAFAQRLDDIFAEPFTMPVEARSSGPSRLTFVLPSGTSIPYTASALSNWDHYRLRVVRRAERFDPGSSSDPSSVADALRYQGLRDSVSTLDRLQEIVDATANDPTTETISPATAIELPFRLILSPAADAQFFVTPVTALGNLQPMWRAELRELDAKRPSLRAIWSPDFRHSAFNRPGEGRGPPRGPWAPWSLPSDDTSPKEHFRTSLDAFDRHQLVGLSSVYGLPVIPRRDAENTLNGSQFAPPPGFRLNDVFPADRTEQAIYRPQALPAKLLSLSAVGGSLDLDASFVPPAAVRDGGGHNLFDAFSVERWCSSIVGGRDIVTEVLYKGFLCPTGHPATMVKVTERRFLPQGPVGRPIAYLIQRMFIQTRPQKDYGAVGQPFAGRAWPPKSIEILTRRTPDILDPTSVRLSDPDTDQVRELSGGRLHIKARVGLVFWPRVVPSDNGNVRFRMRIDKAADAVSMPLIFVDNQAAHDPPTMQALIDYYNSLPDLDPLSPEPTSLRRVAHRGAERRYARELKNGDATFETISWLLRADSRQEAKTVSARPDDPRPLLSAYAMDTALESDDQPPFYPRLESARIRLGQVARFCGIGQGESTVRYWGEYLARDFDASPEEFRRKKIGGDTFLEVLDPRPQLDMGGNGDRAGGVGRPSQTIVALARTGPVGGKADTKEPPPSFSAEFFKSDAKLLGLVSLGTLIGLLAEDSRVAPLLHDVFEYAWEEIAPVLDALDRTTQALDEISKDPLKSVYPAADRALADLKNAIETGRNAGDDTAKRIAAATAIASSAQALKRDLDQIAAAPVAPLAAAAKNALMETDRKIRAAMQKRLQTTDFAALAAALGPVLLPIRFASVSAYLPQLTRQQLEPVASQIDDAIKRTVEASLRPPLPEKLADLRAKAAGDIAAQLRLMKQQVTPALGAAVDDFATAAGRRLAASPSRAVTRLYEQITVQTGLDVFEGLRRLEGDVFSWFELWFARGADALCRQAAEATKAILRVLLPVGFDPAGCAQEAACPATSSDALCTQLWELSCALPQSPPGDLIAKVEALKQASRNLAGALEVLSLSFEQLATFIASPTAGCANVPIAPLQQVEEARSSFGTAVAAWIDDAATLATLEIDVAIKRQLCKAADRAIEILVPRLNDLAALDLAIEGLASSAVAKEVAGALENAKAAIDQVRKDLEAGAQGTDPAAKLASARDAMKAQLNALKDTAAQAMDVALLAAVAPTQNVLQSSIASVLPPLKFAYDAIVEERRKAIGIAASLSNLAGSAPTDADATLACALVVPKPTSAASCVPEVQDDLTQERDSLALLLGQDLPAIVNGLRKLLDQWRRNGGSAPQRLVSGIDDNLKRALTAEVLQLLPVDEQRQALQAVVDRIVPTRRRLTYDYALPLKAYPEGGLVQFQPLGNETQRVLTLLADVQVDLRNPDRVASTFHGHVGAFDIEIKDFIVLHFGAFDFRSGAGVRTTFDAPFQGVTIKEGLAFLAALGAYLGWKGDGGTSDEQKNGPYVLPRPTGAGVKAGFGLGIGTFSVGAMGFANVFFDAHCELPFNGDEAVTRLALSSRAAPFTMFAGIYGGSGFFQIEGNLQGAKRFDVSFEWGGASAISYGPLEGVGRIMTGIYVSKSGELARLYATFTAAFVGHVASFGIAACFYLAMTQEPNGGNLSGFATLTYTFSVGLAKVSFSVTVRRREQNNFGGSERKSAALETPDLPRLMLASLGTAGAVCSRPLARVTSHAPSPLADWDGYRRLYNSRFHAKGRRRK